MACTFIRVTLLALGWFVNENDNCCEDQSYRLTCSSGVITRLNWGNMGLQGNISTLSLPDLKSVDVSNNNITDIDAFCRNDLEWLDISYNPIGSCLPNTDHLIALGINKNSLESNATSVDLSFSMIDTLQLPFLTNLTAIHPLSPLSIDLCNENLREVSISDSPILSPCIAPNATFLSLRNTSVTPSQLNSTYENLEFLDVSYNNITQLNLSSNALPNLQTLSLQGNHISELSICTLSSLDFLNVLQNNMTAAPECVSVLSNLVIEEDVIVFTPTATATATFFRVVRSIETTVYIPSTYFSTTTTMPEEPTTTSNFVLTITSTNVPTVTTIVTTIPATSTIDIVPNESPPAPIIEFNAFTIIGILLLLLYIISAIAWTILQFTKRDFAFDFLHILFLHVALITTIVHIFFEYEMGINLVQLGLGIMIINIATYWTLMNAHGSKARTLWFILSTIALSCMVIIVYISVYLALYTKGGVLATWWRLTMVTLSGVRVFFLLIMMVVNFSKSDIYPLKFIVFLAITCGLDTIILATTFFLKDYPMVFTIYKSWMLAGPFVGWLMYLILLIRHSRQTKTPFE